MSGATLTALIALAPAIVGPLPVEQGSAALVLALCGGGSVTISLDKDQGTAPPLATTPCCAKGCRSGSKKRLLDPRQ